MDFKLNLNLNVTAKNQAPKLLPVPVKPAAKPLPIFSQALKEEENVAAPMSTRELVNLQILESSKKEAKKALKLQAEAIASGVDFNVDSYIQDGRIEPEEISLPTKQTMQGKSKYLGQLMKARERRDRDKL